MANIKSAKKRVLVTQLRTDRNRAIKSALKTELKKFEAAVVSGDGEMVKTLYPATVAQVDSSCSKGVMHKNKANRTKAQLAKKLHSFK